MPIDLESLTPQQRNVAAMVAEEAQRQGVDPEFAVSIALQESGLNAGVKKSSKGAIGVMQITPDTAKSFGVNPNDLPENIKGGVSNIKELFTTYGSPFKVAVGYNSSTATRKKFNELYTQDPDAAIRSLPPETRKYLEGVGQNYNLDEPAPSGDEFVPSATGFAQQNTETPKQRDFLDNVIAAGQQHPILTGGSLGLAKGILFDPKEATPPKGAKLEAAELRQSSAEKYVRDLEEQARGIGGDRIQHFSDVDSLYKESQTPFSKSEAELEEAVQKLRASGARVEGASGASNWMRSMAGPQHQLPENILASATDMTKASPTGGQRLIDEDVLNLKKIKGMGAGNYALTGEGPGQLMLPAGQANEARAVHQAELEALRKRYDSAKAAHVKSTTAVSDLDAARKAAFKAKSYAESVAEKRPPLGKLAEYGYKLAGVKPILNKVLNVAGGVGTALTADEAIRRFKQGDKTRGVMNTIAALAGAASLVPVRNPATAAVKLVGTGVGLGMIPVMAGYDYLNPEQPAQKKKRGGLVRNSR